MNLFLKNFLLGICLIFLTWTSSIAQVSLIAPSLNVDHGETISVDVKVAGFTDVISMQFTLEWDSTILSYSSLSSFDLPELTGGNFNTIATSGGRLTLSWIDNDLGGISVADNAAVFTIDFEVIGADNTTTPMAFTGVPTSVEVTGYINGDDEVLDVTLEHGLINVNGINSIVENSLENERLLQQNFPNPFREMTYLPIDLPHADHINLAIYDNYGRVIHKTEKFFLGGKHILKLDSSIFPSKGIYTVKLFTSDFLATKQLIFLN